MNSAVRCFSLEKSTKCLPQNRFSRQIFGHLAGSTKLDRPHRKEFRKRTRQTLLHVASRRFAALLGPVIFQKNSRRLELSISKNTPHGRWGQGPGSVDPRFSAGLPFPVPEILEFVAFGDSGKIFQQFSRNFPGTFLQNSRKDPRNSHSLLEYRFKASPI